MMPEPKPTWEFESRLIQSLSLSSSSPLGGREERDKNSLEKSQAYKLIPSVCTALIVSLGNRVLLMKRVALEGRAWPGHWCFPGGRLEWGESLLDCAVRELREETGLVVHYDSLDYLCNTDTISDMMHLIGFVYHVWSLDCEPENLQSDSRSEMVWCSWNSLPTPIHPGVSQVIVLMMKHILSQC
jgi:8-oxo-dGTP diphosphatase